jgi:WD40 repeat protein
MVFIWQVVATIIPFTYGITEGRPLSSRSDSPMLTFEEHKAAVRALAWSPHQYGVLLSGGGNSDKSLKFWNISSGSLTASVETESQVRVVN